MIAMIYECFILFGGYFTLLRCANYDFLLGCMMCLKKIQYMFCMKIYKMASIIGHSMQSVDSAQISLFISY